MEGNRIRRAPTFAVAMVLAFQTGCFLANRPWSVPGPIGLQQLEATRFDPYGDADAGPEIVGGRPRDFQKPASEPARSRQFTDTRLPY